jgi:DNA-directed RNA polymerase specialized sigma54-like protein
MALKQQLEQKLQQRLSPQQIQIVRLMELTNLELEERIKQEIIDNPALDEISLGSDGEENSLSKDDMAINNDEGDNEDLSLGDYLSEDDIPDYKISQYEKESGEPHRGDIPFVGGSSIQEYLLEQLGLVELSEIEEKIAEYIIGNIDDDGYLRRPLQSISDDLIFQVGIDIDVKGIELILDKIKEFEPAGVGATTLQECLLLQLNRFEHCDSSVIAAKEIINNHFDAFSKKHYDKIGKSLGLDNSLLKKTIKTLTQLNPRPGNAWNTSYADTGNQIIPDFIIEDNKGNSGTVTEISLFYTKLQTIDDRTVVLPNGTLANTSLTNVTKTPNRMLELKFSVAYEADWKGAMGIIADAFKTDEACIDASEVEVYLDELAGSAIMLGGRCYVKNDQFRYAKQRILEKVLNRFNEEGIEIPYQKMVVLEPDKENK